MRKFKRKLDQQNIKKMKIDYPKHYCLLLMTNWILSELHYKYTMSYDERPMTNIELQNISEILKAITLSFQQPDNLNEKNVFYKCVIDEYRDKISSYYQQAIESDIFQITESQISSYLIKYEHCLKMFSFNDVRIFCDLVKSAIAHNINLDLSPSVYQFVNNLNTVYASNTRIKFRQKQYDAENIYFMLKIDQKKIVQDITNFYLGKEYPLNELPQLTQILLKSSNLNIFDALQISQSLQFLKKLDSKQILKNLAMVQQNFQNLKISQSKILNEQFQKSFMKKITRNLVNKSQLIRHKQNICTEINNNIEIIQYYRKKMKSQNFYKNVTDNFILNAKIKVYVGIQNGILEVSKIFPENGKKLQINSIIMSKKNNGTQEKQAAIKNNVLAETFRPFQNILKVIEWISQVQPTKKAFIQGKKMQAFNDFFKNFCHIISESIDSFISSQKYLQHLDVQKFRNLINERIGEILLSEMRLIEVDIKKPTAKQPTLKQIKESKDINKFKQLKQKLTDKAKDIGCLEKDGIFLRKLQSIDCNLFYTKQLSELNLQEFLFEEAIIKFNGIEMKTTAKQKIHQFDMLIKMIFSIISLSIKRQKITAEIINPIIQYVILKSKFKHCYKNLQIIQCLLENYNNETSYILTLWDSALSYLNTITNQSLQNS